MKMRSRRTETVSIHLAMILLLFTVAYCGNGSSTGPSGSGDAYYVATNGDDSSAGTIDAPWASVNYAASQLMAGDTVYVRGGTYNERVVPLNSGTSSDNRISYLAYGTEIPIIDGTGVTIPAGWGGLFHLNGVSHILVQGLTIQNAGPDDNHCGILIDNCSTIEISQCNTYNTVSSGIGVWDSDVITLDNNDVQLACNDGEQECITVANTSVFTISNNHVHNSGPGTIGGEGIDAKDGSSVGSIYGNIVHDINRIGIYVDSWDKSTSVITVYGNLVYNTTDDGFAVAAEAGGELSSVSIYNNIACFNAGSGLVVAGWGEPGAQHPMDGILIVNNTFHGNGTGNWGCGVSVENSEADNVTIRNNICSSNIIQISTELYGTGLAVDHNLIDGNTDVYGSDYVEGNPNFTDPAGRDFHVGSSSVAVDAGSSSGAPSDDYDGNSRPSGSGWDIGAFEYQH